MRVSLIYGTGHLEKFPKRPCDQMCCLTSDFRRPGTHPPPRRTFFVFAALAFHRSSLSHLPPSFPCRTACVVPCSRPFLIFLREITSQGQLTTVTSTSGHLDTWHSIHSHMRRAVVVPHAATFTTITSRLMDEGKDAGRHTTRMMCPRHERRLNRSRLRSTA